MWCDPLVYPRYRQAWRERKLTKTAQSAQQQPGDNQQQSPDAQQQAQQNPQQDSAYDESGRLRVDLQAIIAAGERIGSNPYAMRLEDVLEYVQQFLDDLANSDDVAVQVAYLYDIRRILGRDSPLGRRMEPALSECIRNVVAANNEVIDLWPEPYRSRGRVNAGAAAQRPHSFRHSPWEHILAVTQQLSEDAQRSNDPRLQMWLSTVRSALHSFVALARQALADVHAANVVQSTGTRPPIPPSIAGLVQFLTEGGGGGRLHQIGQPPAGGELSAEDVALWMAEQILARIAAMARARGVTTPDGQIPVWTPQSVGIALSMAAGEVTRQRIAVNPQVVNQARLPDPERILEEATRLSRDPVYGQLLAHFQSGPNGQPIILDLIREAARLRAHLNEEVRVVIPPTVSLPVLPSAALPSTASSEPSALRRTAQQQTAQQQQGTGQSAQQNQDEDEENQGSLQVSGRQQVITGKLERITPVEMVVGRWRFVSLAMRTPRSANMVMVEVWPHELLAIMQATQPAASQLSEGWLGRALHEMLTRPGAERHLEGLVRGLTMGG